VDEPISNISHTPPIMELKRFTSSIIFFISDDFVKSLVCILCFLIGHFNQTNQKERKKEISTRYTVGSRGWLKNLVR
jgi:hypothetical protein